MFFYHKAKSRIAVTHLKLDPVAVLGIAPTALNLMGNLGARTVFKAAPSYSGAIIAGISSTALFILAEITDEDVVPYGSKDESEKKCLYTLTITLIGGGALPYLLSPLTKQTVGLSASIGYAILGYFGACLGFVALNPHDPARHFRLLKKSHLPIWNYFKG